MENNEKVETPPEHTAKPKSRGFLNTKAKKFTAIGATLAVLLAGGGTAAWAVTDANRTKAYDATVEQSHELIAEIKALSNDLSDATYLTVTHTDDFEATHIKQLTTISKISDKLVSTETLEPVKTSVDELNTLYVAPEPEEGEADDDKGSEETAETENTEQAHPFYSDIDREYTDGLNDLFAETGEYLPVPPADTVTPPSTSEELGNRPTDDQIAEADAALEANTEHRDNLLETLSIYTSKLAELDARVISDAELLVAPAEEAIENAESFVSDFKKADDKSKKTATDAKEALAVALEQYRSGELPEAEPEAEETPAEDDSEDTTEVKETDESTEEDESEEPEPVITDLFTYEHEADELVQLELATNLREAFTDFISAHTAVKKSHDDKVKKEKEEEAKKAAEEAAAAGAAEYHDPVTNTWVPTPTPSWSGGNNWSGGSAGGGGSTGGSSSGGNSGGGWTPAPAPSGGGGGGGGGTPAPAPAPAPPAPAPAPPARTCPPLQPGYYYSGSTHTIDGLTCPNQVPYGSGGADDW